MQDGRPYVESWTEDPNPDPDANPGTISDPGQWYGEYLWRITFNVPKGMKTFWYRKCAIDAAGNRYCTAVESVDDPNFDETTTSDTSSATTDSNSDTDFTTSDSTTGGNTMSGGDSTTTITTIPTTGSDDITLTNATASESETLADSASELDDDGCGCDTDQSPTQGVLASFALLGLLGLRRRRTA
jgi:MYXO-CTERM domain-containing protein